ncbi:TetR/AcrR family transcriptional regulator [Pseudonocardia halophobica]|uniref:TetR family transcriptional regulator n=1 Tax=Pseudonocardia halophobica TaxID=29401 RepID=A0A9W6L5P9_9PSEU|nr:TetR/AcrR family transcriptional regulator [Pseudonocardia halophobica]GLL12516.1 TetR family transcriptional regulator [Pseudonocardia halophobica]
MSASPAAGRPRNPDVDRRVARAAVELFGSQGWAGFSVEAVARRAGVGKASIYLRWPSKEALLVGALAERVPVVADVDTGTLRGDLVRLARQLLDMHLGPSGRAFERMGLDAPQLPGVAERWERHREAQVRAARAMIRRGIDRGEIAADTPVTLLLDTLCGGVALHVSSTPERLRPNIDVEDYAERLVTFLLRSVE